MILLFGFWFSLTLHDFSLMLYFGIFYCFFLFLKDKKKIWIWVPLWILSILIIPTKTIAQPGIYTIQEIKTSYVLASDSKSTIVLYGLENPMFHDQVQVNTIEEIQSLNNIHQFNFQSVMNQKNIYYCANVSERDIIQRKNTIKSMIYSKCKNNSYLLMSLYGIVQDDSLQMFARLSSPILVCLHIIKRKSQKILHEKQANAFCLCLGICYGLLFTFKINLIRYILYNTTKFLETNSWTCFCISSFIFLILFPLYAKDFVFVFVSGIFILNHYLNRNKKMATYLYLFSIQFLYFHEINLILFILYPFFKNINALFFLCSFFIELPLFSIPDFTIHYVPNFIFIILFLLNFSFFFQQKRNTILILLFLLSPLYSTKVDPFFHVYVLDIGQGDCTLIVEPFYKSVVMIDCGQNLYRDNVESIIVPVLEDLQIQKIDCLILTHDDFDHSGGYESLKEQIKIENVIQDSSTEIPVDYPFYSLLEQRKTIDENDTSIVSYFVYDNIHYLWTGDASVFIEKQLLQSYDIQVDVLKLAHHGSNTSSSFEFLNQTNPELGIISVGENNKYGHPSKEVLYRCLNCGIDVLMTKDQGMIHIFTWHSFSFFVSASGLIGTL
ncbi:ComEC/Rec2 family competence protein [Floccifex sp.]|uniref:ComEC/Rec2 family competence protein n=1 Tax=Floccifex sp. TaxID=2815810 RepID=UPI003F08004B